MCVCVCVCVCFDSADSEKKRCEVCLDWTGSLTVVEGVSVLQSPQLLKAGVQDPCPVTRHRQSQRLPVWSYRPRPLLAPVERGEIAESLNVR